MNWICEYCCTANDEKDKVCFVCDNERTEKASEELRKNKRKKMKQKVFSQIYEKTIMVSKSVFLVCTVITASVLSVLLIITLLNGNVEKMLGIAISVGKNGHFNTVLFMEKLRIVFEKVVYSFATLNRDMFPVLVSTLTENISIPILVVIPAVLNEMFGNIRSTIPVFLYIIEHIRGVAVLLGNR